MSSVLFLLLKSNLKTKFEGSTLWKTSNRGSVVLIVRESIIVNNYW